MCSRPVARSCTLAAVTARVTNPRIERDPARVAVPFGVRNILGLLHVDEFLYVDEVRADPELRREDDGDRFVRAVEMHVGRLLAARHEQHELARRTDDRDERIRLLHDAAPGRRAS